MDAHVELGEIFTVCRSKGVKVRTEPRSGSDIVEELDFGTRIQVVEKSGPYLRISAPCKGWCKRVFKSGKIVCDRVRTPSIVDDRFLVGATLGKGSFGVVYSGWDCRKDTPVAVKLDMPKDDRRSHFDREVALLDHLNSCEAIPRVIWSGECEFFVEEEEEMCHCSFIIMELQGQDLNGLFEEHSKHVPLNRIVAIADDLIYRMEQIHKSGIVHRDVKPQNFLVGRSEPNRVYVIDFGLSCFYENDGVHVRKREGLKPCGTARYASLNNHRGVNQTRRDDLEAIAYMFIYLLKGGLPWQRKKGKRKRFEPGDRVKVTTHQEDGRHDRVEEDGVIVYVPSEGKWATVEIDGRRDNYELNDKMNKWERILNQKLECPLEYLCEGLPAEFIKYLKYVRKLEHNQEPDYNYLRQMFQDIASRIDMKCIEM